MANRQSPPLRAAERQEIERGLKASDSIRSIAAALGRSPSTVSREVRANRVPASPSVRQRPREGWAEPTCPRLARAPWVCDGCPRAGGACGHAKWAYRAGDASLLSAARRSESRMGIDMEPERAREALAAVSDGLGRGLSPYAVSRGMPEECRVSPGTIYGWVERGYAGTCNLRLPRKVRYKPRKKGAAKGPRRPEGRSYRAFCELPEEERARAWEMDEVKGYAGDRQRLLTLYSRPAKLQLALLADGGSSAAARGALSALAGAAPAAFARAFGGPVLTDNGAEFSDWDGLGAIFGEREGEPPRLYYCDPLASGQKGACEKNHVELRRVLGKGLFSFDLLVPADVALVMSHVNSAPRPSLMGLSPIQMFRAALGADADAILDALGVEQVPPGRLLLRPELINLGRAERGEGPLAM